MNADEANVLLVKIMARDKFRRWQSAAELAYTATEWADDLAHVPLSDALDAMRDHYAETNEPLTISDIIAAVPVRSSSWAGNITEQRLAAEAAGTVKALEPGDV